MFIQALSNCSCCPRNCGVNRLKGKISFCGIDATIPVAHRGLYFGEEPPISGINGSGAIFFEGCNLHCVFCQNYQISQDFRRIPTQILSVNALALEMLKLQNEGAHNINFVSPSHVALQMADAIILAKEQGLTIPIVYNSNGYDSIDTLKKLAGLVDIYLPDIKYMDNALGKRYSNVSDYATIIPNVIGEMYNQVGTLKMNKKGIATTGLLVRHLILPGLLYNSKKCLKLLSEVSLDLHVSLMSQYSPLYKACEFPEISRTLTKDEYNEMVAYAVSIGLENVFIQELQSKEEGLPDFNLKEPFQFDNG